MKRMQWIGSAIMAAVLLVAGSAGLVSALEVEGAKIGGHLKFYTYDKAIGERNGVSQTTNASTGFSEFILYITKQLNDYLAVEVGPMVQPKSSYTGTTSATPVVGKNLGRPTQTIELDMHHAYVSWQLPRDYELKAGLFSPVYSENYGKEIFWYDQYHINNRTCMLEAWHDGGIELYKNYDFSSISLPMYFYVLNGTNRHQDENETKSLLLHAAPEFLNSKLSVPLSGSIGRDASDREVQRHGAGLFWKQGKLTLGGEYFYRVTRNVALGAKLVDGEDWSYYAKILYRYSPAWQLLLKYSNTELYNSKSTAALRKDIYDDAVLALGYYFTPSDMIVLQYSLSNGKVSDNSDKINAQRLTLGWRITF